MQGIKVALLLTTVLAWGLATGAALAQHQPGEHGAHGQKDDTPAEQAKLPTCPVMGGTVDFSVKTMTDDGPVYFCCPGCIEKLEKDPAKYADKVAAQREALAKLPRIQVSCPLSGEPIDRKVFVEQAGEKVYFCCADCKAGYAKNPDKYQAKLAASYTYQTRCPVLGREINPAAYVDLPTKQRVYFCCKGCDDKFLKDPAKYAPKLAAQGTNINVKRLKAALEKQNAAKP